ncbi:hypothetical protein Pmani_030480 [Petrolisthes manimaculis]|uniref:Forkhead box protein N3 n=1 Tax=Petrolisthes manimaculis TaxID=1843537 RepID=A0AAE1TTJ1_9EUCA|nr:hypothetical protein Pmani_030480 [Petrolisthes manimaculis]
MPYNPQVHINAKPPYSFSCLIFMAIEDCTSKALPVKDIYAWILDHFPYFRNAPTGWKNSVRHNLSLNKCFRKVEKAPNLGKGSLWMVDPAYRPNLLQALSKTPFHPYSNLERIYMVSTKVTFSKNNLINNNNNNNNNNNSATYTNYYNSKYGPSRRLGSSVGVGGVCGAGVHREDVDAAAAMLALKNGSHIVTPASESYSQLRNGRDTTSLYEESRKRKRKRKHTEVGDARMVVISSSPSEDHSYYTPDTQHTHTHTHTHRQQHTHPPPPKKAHHQHQHHHHHHQSPTSSVDEAFSDDSYDSDGASVSSQADMRQLVEGADALLNLAAVATSLATHTQQQHEAKG